MRGRASPGASGGGGECSTSGRDAGDAGPSRRSSHARAPLCDLAEEWQPRFDAGFPLAFCVGAVGAGAGVGCGVGLGAGRPVSLGAFPGAGQALGGLGAALGPLAGAAAEARRRVAGLGIRGLDAGVGCGAGVGYGFFLAGVLVKPSAVDAAVEGARRLAGAVTEAVTSSLRAAGLPLGPASYQRTGVDAGGAVGPAAALGPVGAPGALQGWPPGAAAGVPAGLVQALAPQLQPLQQQGGLHSLQQQQQQQLQQAQGDKEVLRALLRHERRLDKLRRQNRSLRASLCRLDLKAPACKAEGWEDSSGEAEGG